MDYGGSEEKGDANITLSHDQQSAQQSPSPEPLPQESPDPSADSAVSEEPHIGNVDSLTMGNVDSLTCPICSSRTFGNRPDLLHHLSLTHFNKPLLDKYPLQVKLIDAFNFLSTQILFRRGVCVLLRTARYSLETRLCICFMLGNSTKGSSHS